MPQFEAGGQVLLFEGSRPTRPHRVSMADMSLFGITRAIARGMRGKGEGSTADQT